MGGPSVASMKFAFWLACATLLLHCLMIPTATTDVRSQFYREKRGVRLTRMMKGEAFVPKSINKRFKGLACSHQCHIRKCASFNVDLATGECELFNSESGGTFVDDSSSSYFRTISDLLCGEMAVENGQTVASGVRDGEAVNVICNDGYEANPSQAICNNGIFNTVTCVQTATTTTTPTTTPTTTTTTPTTTPTTTTTTPTTTPTTTTTTPATTPTIAPITSTTTVPYQNHSILLIGGHQLPSGAALVEYYHPSEDIIGHMSTELISHTYYASGCYLSATEQIVIRESTAYSKPSMLYGLFGSAIQLPLPSTNTNFQDTTSASVGSSKCLSCGGASTTGPTNNCYQFDPSLDGSKWSAISNGYQTSSAASVSLSMKDFFLIGGVRHSELLDVVHRFNVDNGTWTEETPMPTKRMGHAAAALSTTQFIVCGGWLDQNTLSICEIYDTMQKNWNTTGSLNEVRRSFAMISFEQDIYAMGGKDQADIKLNTVERYDRATGEWEMVKAMNHPRAYFVGVAV